MSTAFTLSVIRKAQTEKPWIRRVGPLTYRVTPRTADHGKYELNVRWDDDQPSVELCVDYRTGEECKGFMYDRGNCYHSAALLLHLVTKRRSHVERVRSNVLSGRFGVS